MKQKFIIYSFIFFILLGCSQNRYDIAKGLHKSGKYALSINFYDQFISYEERGSQITDAELARSECYLQLGLKAYEKFEWTLANRFFYLANSEKADSFMDNCYYELAKEAIAIDQIDTALNHFDFVLKNLKKSELIPEILYTRLNIYLNQGKKLLAYDDYNTLATLYPDDDFTKTAQPDIDKNMEFYIQDAIRYSDTEFYTIAIEKLLYLEKNPSVHKLLIQSEIANVYMKIAEIEVKKKNFIHAKRFFENALEWDKDKQNMVNDKLNSIVNSFIEKGDELVRLDKIDEALAHYREIFDIIPAHSIAKKQIEEAEKMKANYILANELISEAEKLEKNKKYADALKKYEYSNQLRRQKVTTDKIERVKNLIEAEKDPVGFARSLVTRHQGGLIASKVEEIERELKITYRDLVKSSGWRVLYAFGEFKYEIRYDITSPGKNYYFVWRVDLETGAILPLNKISEEILTIQ
jgi:tetratricopeptide (TPR) repeat protein